MAGFQTKTFEKHDDYMTPKSAWEAIKQFVPENKVVWEPFYGDGRSGEILREIGFDVIHQDASISPQLQIIIPRRRIQFVKLVDGEVPEDYKSKCNFDCFYYCWKMNLPRDIVWLEN